MDEPYQRHELKELGDGFPPRGPICDCCGVRVPQFADLEERDRARVLQLIRDNRDMVARQELIAATGCSERWAKIWVQHRGRPQPRFPGPPCPFCGVQLPSLQSQQCLHCKADWHLAEVQPVTDVAPPLRGSLVWHGPAGGETWYVFFERLAAPSEIERAETVTLLAPPVWILRFVGSGGSDEERSWSPRERILFGTLSGWSHSDIKALKAALILAGQRAEDDA